MQRRASVFLNGFKLKNTHKPGTKLQKKAKAYGTVCNSSPSQGARVLLDACPTALVLL